MGDDEDAIKRLREYIRIKAVHPKPDYAGCVKFLKKLASRMKLPIKVFGAKKKPVVVITWEGRERKLPTILLNSHMDVLPVCEDKWTYKPFEAYRDKQGNIYGPGTQGMKSIGMQQLEAVRKLTQLGYRPKRTVHISFVPDQETGGIEGMGKFVTTNDFKLLNVGFALDESSPSMFDFFIVYYTERMKTRFLIKCAAQINVDDNISEHATAGEKMRAVLDEIYNRKSEEMKLISKEAPHGVDPTSWVESVELGQLTTMNLAELKGGITKDERLPEISAYFDCRLSIQEDEDRLREWLENICEKVGQDANVEVCASEPNPPPTDYENNPFCVAMFQELTKHHYTFKIIGCHNTKAARYLRQAGIPTIGLSPIRGCEIRLNRDNEYIPQNSFLEGIFVFMVILRAVTDV